MEKRLPKIEKKRNTALDILEFQDRPKTHLDPHKCPFQNALPESAKVENTF